MHTRPVRLLKLKVFCWKNENGSRAQYLSIFSVFKVKLKLLPQPSRSQVQLQLLTAIVKLFLKKPTETQELVQQVLSLATQVSKPSFVNTQ